MFPTWFRQVNQISKHVSTFGLLWFNIHMLSSAPTRADEVYQRLRREILTGRLAPGARLRFAELSTRYDTSTGVLREALPRLVEQGLVVSKPQIGFRVASASPEDLRQLTEVRIVVETLALRLSVEHGDLAWESDILAAHHTLSRLPMLTADNDVDESWLEAHAAFHSTLLQGCPNLRLRNMAELLRDSAEIYRCWSAKTGQDRDRDVAGEHRRIMETALARETAAASAALSEHIQLTTDILLESHAGCADTVVQSRLTPGPLSPEGD
jgi:DNA-binding GntR family transcriptional regulator